MLSRHATYGSLALVCMALSLACSEAPQEEAPPPTPPQIPFFKSQPGAISAGESALLRWQVHSAHSLQLEDENGEALELSPEALEAQELEVRPTRATTYTLRALGAEGLEAEAQTRVLFRAAPPTILSFTATPEQVPPGQPVLLSWESADAEDLRIVAKDGSVVASGDASLSKGSVEVQAKQWNRSYTLYASNPLGTASATLSLEVEGGKVEAELEASPRRLPTGEEATLHWRSRGATRILLRADEEILLEKEGEASGSLRVSPSSSQRYQLIAYGEGDLQASAEAQVLVLPVVDRFEATEDGPFPRGALVELAWELRGAETLRIENGAGWRYDVEADEIAAGSVSAPLPADGRFLLSASAGGQGLSRSLLLPILEKAEVQEFSITPQVLTVDAAQSGEVELRWKTARASTLQIQEQGGALLYEAASEADEGSLRLPISETTTYLFSARNAAGAASRSETVRVYPPVSIVSLASWPAQPGVDEPFFLRWEAPGAASVELRRDGALIHQGSGSSGQLRLQLGRYATFYLRAINGAGETAEEKLLVNVGPPSIRAFEVERQIAGPGSSLRFSWRNRGGTTLHLLGPDREIACSTEEPDRIPEGDCTVLLPQETGAHLYSLVLSNSLAQRDTAELQVEVRNGPRLLDFYATDTQLSLGESTTLHWRAAADPFGNSPTLQLDDLSSGSPEALPFSQGEGLEGSIPFTPTASGLRTLRLTASTPDTTPSSREISLRVHALPTLEASASSLIHEPAQGPVRLSWETEDAVSLHIYEGGPGLQERLEVSFWDPARVAAGSYELQPPSPGRDYRLVAQNQAGGSVSQVISITWSKPTVAYFAALPAEIVASHSSELQWESSGAEVVRISPPPTTLGQTFSDLRDDPAAEELALSDCGAGSATDGCVAIDLPFAFPHAGERHLKLRAYQHGAAGFDLSYAGPSLPAAGAGFAAFAPFWQELRRMVEGEERQGRLLSLAAQDEAGAYVIVQWTDFWPAGASGSLTFQLLLHEDGSFGYRYGELESVRSESVDGSLAMIGHLQGDGSWRALSSEQAVPGGLSQLSLHFPASFPDSGWLTLRPLHLGDHTYVLEAENGAGTSSAQATLKVVEGPLLWGVETNPALPAPGLPFELLWLSQNASQVMVELPVDPADEEGQTILCVVDPGLEAERCELEEPAAGSYRYVMRAVGVGGAELLREVEVVVAPLISIDSFEATPNPLVEGEQLQLSWVTSEVDTLRLWEGEVEVDISAVSVSAGTLLRQPMEDTEYVLRGTSLAGREVEERLMVIVEEAPGDGAGGAGGDAGAGGSGGEGGGGAGGSAGG